MLLFQEQQTMKHLFMALEEISFSNLNLITIEAVIQFGVCNETQIKTAANNL